MIVPFTGSQPLLLKYMLGLASLNTDFTVSSTDGPVLRLFTNNIPIVDTILISDLVECTATGYTAQTLPSSNWSITQLNPAGFTTGYYAEQVFNMTGPAICYGYYVTDMLGNLLWAERFSDGPYSIASAVSGSMGVLPQFSITPITYNIPI